MKKEVKTTYRISEEELIAMAIKSLENEDLNLDGLKIETCYANDDPLGKKIAIYIESTKRDLHGNV